MSTMYTLPDALRFNRIVWEIVRQIPTGQVATYGQIAQMIPAPDTIPADVYAKLGPRWVGDAMNAVSRVDDPTIPWHRVINAKGGISLPDESVSAALQRARLRLEQSLGEASERVDLKLFGWVGPSAEWRAEHGLNPPPALAEGDDAPVQMPLL